MAEVRVAFIFPGQGSQAVGMGRDLFEGSLAARAVFEEADRVLGMPLSRLCFEGPAEELVKTVNVQPAVLTVSLACLRAAQETGRLPVPNFTAGHSLGEYTALVAAGAMPFADGLRLVRERGRLMQEAGERNPGGMLALLGADVETIESLCRQSGCYIANINCPGQVVVSGPGEAIDRARGLARDRGIKAVPLKVSGAFHSPLMGPALAGLRTALASVTFKDAEVPVVSNVTGRPFFSASQVRDELVAQLENRVQWQKSVEYMVSAGVTTFLEIGPGNVLSGLVKRTAPAARVYSLGDGQTIAGALASLYSDSK
ncbi:MAG: ACP S-malonyltransferase [Dehalococcoidia bacterium]|nr:ACP S-malonyltransferase [Dehalococcoidia bacterium]